MRTVPSAGARHAFETYLYLQRVEGLAPGLYRFLPLEHALVELSLDSACLSAVPAAFKLPALVEQSAVTFLWAAVAARMEYLFGLRAYRYLFLDAGHVCQNLYLAAHTLQLGTCAIGSFDDQRINAALALDGEAEFLNYAASVGKQRG